MSNLSLQTNKKIDIQIYVWMDGWMVACMQAGMYVGWYVGWYVCGYVGWYECMDMSMQAGMYVGWYVGWYVCGYVGRYVSMQVGMLLYKVVFLKRKYVISPVWFEWSHSVPLHVHYVPQPDQRISVYNSRLPPVKK